MAETLKDVEQFAKVHGFPFIIKASLGGGGRGMRIVRNESELKESFERPNQKRKPHSETMKCMLKN